MRKYNGLTNRETWLVKLWYMREVPHYFALDNQYHVEPSELEEFVINMECEQLTQEIAERKRMGLPRLTSGLTYDILTIDWDQVNWHELADGLNDTLAANES